MVIKKNSSKPAKTSFEASFDDFLTARCEQILTEQVLQDPEYRRYRAEIAQAADTICGILNDTQKQHYYSLESAEGMSMNLAVLIVYKQGVKDGTVLKGILGLE